MRFVEQSLAKQMAKRSSALGKAALAGGVLLLLCGSLAAWGIAPLPRKHPKNGPVRNYAVAWPGKMMRSGKPYSQADWTWVHQQGVKSIEGGLQEVRL
jgi:hypothetical protein